MEVRKKPTKRPAGHKKESSHKNKSSGKKTKGGKKKDDGEEPAGSSDSDLELKAQVQLSMQEASRVEDVFASKESGFHCDQCEDCVAWLHLNLCLQFPMLLK